MNAFVKLIRKIVLKEKATPDIYIKHLKKIGITIGEGTMIYSPNKVLIDEQYPWLISIGKNVQITDGVKILSHGYDWSVVKAYYGNVIGVANKVEIGDNVFIGMNTIILGDCKIGNNVIIGAASLVNKDVPDNVVVAGNPAHVIMSLEEYYSKRIKQQKDQAIRLARSYYLRTNQIPPKKLFHEFFWLFEERKKEIDSCFSKKMDLLGNRDVSFDVFMKESPVYRGYNDFIENALKGII